LAKRVLKYTSSDSSSDSDDNKTETKTKDKKEDKTVDDKQFLYVNYEDFDIKKVIVSIEESERKFKGIGGYKIEKKNYVLKYNYSPNICDTLRICFRNVSSLAYKIYNPNDKKAYLINKFVKDNAKNHFKKQIPKKQQIDSCIIQICNIFKDKELDVSKYLSREKLTSLMRSEISISDLKNVLGNTIGLVCEGDHFIDKNLSKRYDIFLRFQYNISTTSCRSSNPTTYNSMKQYIDLIKPSDTQHTEYIDDIDFDVNKNTLCL